MDRSLRLRVFASWLLGGAALVPLPLMAAPSADVGPAAVEAGERYQQGIKLYEDGDYAASLAEFRRAYSLAPAYQVLFNLARVHRQMQNYIEAQRHFERYLREGGRRVPRARAEEVRRELDELRKRVARLDIRCGEPDVEIFLDDESVGKTPLTEPVLVNAGRRRLTAVKPLYETFRTTLEVVGAETRVVVIALIEQAPAAPVAGSPAVVDPAVPVAPGRPACRRGPYPALGHADLAGLRRRRPAGGRGDHDRRRVVHACGRRPRAGRSLAGRPFVRRAAAGGRAVGARDRFARGRIARDGRRYARLRAHVAPVNPDCVGGRPRRLRGRRPLLSGTLRPHEQIMKASPWQTSTPNGVGSIGKFRLLTKLGSGGMADVYLALARGPSMFAKLAVLKRLKQSLADEPDALAMFLSEAQLAARLNHPNVVQTFEVGGDGDEHYLVMEYLDGQSLDRLVRRAPPGEPRTLPCLLRALCDALGGLHYAHELCDYDGTPLNVVHRDVSPRNVFVTYEGATKVLDFGIAKALRASHVSRAGTLKGTVRYMAPEQVLGLDVDRRADLFALGVTLWELVSGRRMWPGLDDIAILQRLLQGQIPLLGEAKPDAPPELARVCARALAVAPADRYPSALYMRTELEAAMAALGLESTHADLSGLIANVFRDERQALRELIEEQFVGAPEVRSWSAAGGALAGGARPGDAPAYGAGGAAYGAAARCTGRAARRTARAARRTGRAARHRRTVRVARRPRPKRSLGCPRPCQARRLP